jgi:hypothetical protein
LVGAAHLCRERLAYGGREIERNSVRSQIHRLAELRAEIASLLAGTLWVRSIALLRALGQPRIPECVATFAEKGSHENEHGQIPHVTSSSFSL